MLKPAFLLSLVFAVASTSTSTAKDYPLEIKTIKAEQVMAFPGGYGAHGMLSLRKPAGLKREPRAVSRHAIYGQFGENGPNAMVFRLDESKGDGQGYDRLIVDLNRNGDLTDDAVTIPAAEPATAARVRTSTSEQKLFGPVTLSADKTTGGTRPIYYAQMYLYNRQLLTAAARSAVQTYFGTLIFKAGWYLEATVDLKGVPQKIGVYDGDANLQLGNPWKSRPQGSGPAQQFYFPVGDSFLCDVDRSGKFENNQFNTETSPFGPALYADDTPLQVVISPDRKSVQITPWPTPLATLAVQPQGYPVRDISLAWEQSPGQWQLLKARVINGKTSVPPGNYWLYSTVMAAGAGNGDMVMLSGLNHSAKNAFRASAGQVTTVRCGAPLELKLAAEKDKYASANGYTVRVQAQVLGQGGETFSSFAKGRNFTAPAPASPVFKVLAQDGRQLDSGKMEFG